MIDDISEKFALGFGYKRPYLYSGKKSKILLSFLVVYYGLIASKYRIIGESNYLRSRNRFVIDKLRRLHVLNPGKIVDEKRTSIEPHASVLI